ncbi:hypothetical protein ACHAQH_001496 [Verticillium albo-atrum]
MNSSSSADVTKPLPSPVAQTARPFNAAHLSFAKRKEAQRKQQMTPLHPLVEGDHRLLRPIHRPLPGDATRESMKSKSQPGLAKSRSTFFESAFQAGREVSPAKDRIRGEAIVMTEVRTNVIVADEFSLITDLSYQLSIRYKRPVSSIVVILQHGVCMLFGGSFDPAYTMSIFALPVEFAPTKNKRNAALIQKHMERSLCVTPSRGYLRFIPLSEENVAWNGRTAAGEMEAVGEDDQHSSSKMQESRRKLSVKSLSSLKPALTNRSHAPEYTPPHCTGEGPPVPLMATVSEEEEFRLSDITNVQGMVTGKGEKPRKRPKMSRRTSFVASLFGRSKMENEPAVLATK